MARKGNKKTLGIERDTLYSIAAICSFALGILLALAAFDSAGVAGEKLYGAFSLLLGVGYLLLPLFFLLLSFALARAARVHLFGVARATGALLFLASALGLAELAFPGRGGLIGGWLASPFVALFDATASAVLLAAIVLVALALLFNAPLTAHLGALSERVREWRGRRREARDERDADASAAPEIEEYGADADETEEEESDEEDKDTDDEPDSKKGVIEKAKDAVAGVFSPVAAPFGDYDPPPLSLLEKDKGKPNAGDVKANANVIKRTLANFGIVVEIEEVTVGPSVTRYAIKPAEGVRLSKIVGLQNNLELALAAHPVRIEAPIPGRSLVGVEIPNTAKARVGLGALIADPVVRDAPDPLFFPVGRTVSGVIKGTNLAKLPHLLVAGATGAGKSVAIHTLVTSLLYRNSPESLRLILVDPKRVELTLYNGIPHLLSPVLTDPKKAILALKWLVGEMERRYNVLETHRVRDIASYHDTVLADTEPAETDGESDDQESGPEPMPYIVVVIDELADIMSSYPRELESAIVRLAQMSRAVGIHLVLSTQRPSVNVITGLIKANIPGRIALQVASQVDSRTILDARGAETLLGSGDMLFSSAEMSKPVRLQGGFISEGEVKKVSKYLSNNYDTEGELDFSDADGDEESGGFDDSDDDLYEDAREAVVRAKKASTSYLQRKLRIGYSRAARLMDMLEDRSVIGPADGSKPRDVLVESPDENYDE